MQLGFNHIESVLTWDLKDRFSLDAKSTGYFFAFMGVIMAIVQGGLYRMLVKKYSLINLSQVGAILLIVGFILMPISHPIVFASLSIVILAVGMGISSPSVMTIASIRSDESEQGLTMGILQSFGSLSRVISPLTATITYDIVNHGAPYYISAILLTASLILIISSKKEITD